MTAPCIISNTIQINASADQVWNALTNPAETRKYMFGCETVSDWHPGSSLLWEGEWEGKKMVFVKGVVVSIDPGKQLVYTVFDPNNAAMEDKPENYLTVSYHLTQEENGTRLTVTQGDYSTVADGERRYKESYNNGQGWDPILEKIRAQVEGGTVV